MVVQVATGRTIADGSPSSSPELKRSSIDAENSSVKSRDDVDRAEMQPRGTIDRKRSLKFSIENILACRNDKSDRKCVSRDTSFSRGQSLRRQSSREYENEEKDCKCHNPAPIHAPIPISAVKPSSLPGFTRREQLLCGSSRCFQPPSIFSHADRSPSTKCNCHRDICCSKDINVKSSCMLCMNQHLALLAHTPIRPYSCHDEQSYVAFPAYRSKVQEEARPEHADRAQSTALHPSNMEIEHRAARSPPPPLPASAGHTTMYYMHDKCKGRRIGHPYQSRAPPKRKPIRHSFTANQVAELEKLFEKSKYLSSSERQRLASELKMTDSQLKTWYQNRRTKLKREMSEIREHQQRVYEKMAAATIVRT